MRFYQCFQNFLGDIEDVDDSFTFRFFVKWVQVIVQGIFVLKVCDDGYELLLRKIDWGN